MELKIIRQSELDGESIDYGVSNAQTRRRLIVIYHKEEQLQWNIPSRVWSVSPRASDDPDIDVFKEINRYIATLPWNVQDSMFDIYRDINKILKNTDLFGVNAIDNIIEKVTPLAKALFNFINPEQFTNWVWTTLRPSMPSDLKDVFTSSMPGSVERTYLSGDYYKLIPLVIIVRLACPFWFDFSDLLKDELHPDSKDVYAFSLIDQTWVASSEAMKRLEVFVDHTTGSEKYSDAVVMSGIGSANYVNWVLSGLIVKRVPIVEVMDNNSDTPVVSALFNYIRYRMTSVISGGPRVNAKFVDTSGDGESNLSYLEGFRNPQQLSEGDKQVNDYYPEFTFNDVMNGIIRPMSLLDRVAPGIDYRLVVDAYNSCKKLENYAIAEEQEALASWLFHPYSQVRAVGNFHKERVIQMLSMAQAVFLHQGKLDLAYMVSAKYVSESPDMTMVVIGSGVETPKIQEREEFKKFFPLEKVFQGNKKPRNHAYDDLERMVRNLQTYDIFCTFSDETLRKYQGNNVNRRYTLKRNTMSMLMDYVKELAVRPTIKIDPMKVFHDLAAKKYASQQG